MLLQFMLCLISLIGEQTKECEALHLTSADYASQLGDLNATVWCNIFTFFSVLPMTYMLTVFILVIVICIMSWKKYS